MSISRVYAGAAIESTQVTQNKQFDDFFELVLEHFVKELNHIASAFYNYDKSNDGSVGYDNLFKIIERTWVGIFQSALIKAHPNEVTCLQEFNVIDGERVFGRCDLLFQLTLDGKKYDFITEAKCYEFTDDFAKALNETFYNRLFNQAEGYYEVEKAFYKNETYLLALTFEWIRNSVRLNKAEAVMKTWPANAVKPDFIALYKGFERGAFVYGKLKKVHSPST